MNNKTPEVELLPCPFCGSTAEFGRVNDAEMGDFGGEFIQCTNHGCATSSMLIFPTMADATPLLVEKWNRRAADRALRQGDAGMLELPEPAGIVMGFTEEGQALVDHACEGPIPSLEENQAIYTADQVQEYAQAALAAKDADISKLRNDAERLTNELMFIANADVASWDDPSEFKAWAQNRARAAIAKEKAK